MAAHTKVGVATIFRSRLTQKQDDRRAGSDQSGRGYGLLTETAEPARAILDVEHIDVVADRATSRSRYRGLREGGMTPYVPNRNGIIGEERPLSQGRVPLRRGARCICVSGGEALSRNHESTLRDLKRFHYTNPAACSACPLRVRCTTTANRRQVTRLENEAVLDRVAARLKARPWVLDRGASGRASLRLDQAMDVSGRLSHQGPRKSSRRVQPDGACL